MTTDAHDELYAKATAATPGPWKYQAVNRIGKNDAFVPEDARYIAAAHPAAILALIDEVRRLRAEVAELECDNDALNSCDTAWCAEHERLKKALVACGICPQCECKIQMDYCDNCEK